MAEHNPPEPTGAVPGEATLTGQYEQLREIAWAGHGEGWRHGLGVLATRGMTGWMSVCRNLAPASTPAPSVRAGVEAMRPAAAELVAVMAAMALAHI